MGSHCVRLKFRGHLENFSVMKNLASAKCRKRVVPNEEGNDTYELPAQCSSTGSHGQLHADKGVSERREPGPQWNQDYKNMKVPGKGFPEYRKSWNITPWMVMKSTS